MQRAYLNITVTDYWFTACFIFLSDWRYSEQDLPCIRNNSREKNACFCLERVLGSVFLLKENPHRCDSKPQECTEEQWGPVACRSVKYQPLQPLHNQGHVALFCIFWASAVGFQWIFYCFNRYCNGCGSFAAKWTTILLTDREQCVSGKYELR